MININADICGKIKDKILIFISLYFIATTNMAQAIPTLGGTIYVENNGEVTAKYLGSSAAYTSTLYLYSPRDDDLFIFNSKTTPIGSTVSLGTFIPGEELIFKIFVKNTGYSFFSGSNELLNPDKKLHTMVDFDWLNGETYLGFEDLYGGGDNDFNDVKFSFSNVTSSPINIPVPIINQIPEPNMLFLFLIGITCLFMLKSSRRQTYLNNNP